MTAPRSRPPSVWPVWWFGPDAQRQHAQRLLLSGFDCESAATLSGLSVAEVRELVASVGDELNTTP